MIARHNCDILTHIYKSVKYYVHARVNLYALISGGISGAYNVALTHPRGRDIHTTNDPCRGRDAGRMINAIRFSYLLKDGQRRLGKIGRIDSIGHNCELKGARFCARARSLDRRNAITKRARLTSIFQNRVSSINNVQVMPDPSAIMF